MIYLPYFSYFFYFHSVFLIQHLYEFKTKSAGQNSPPDDIEIEIL